MQPHPISIRVRSYIQTDYPAVVDLFVPGMMMNATLGGQSTAFWKGYVAMSLRTDLADIEAAYFAPGGHFWVAVVDGTDEIVGIVGLEKKNKSVGELRRMSVKNEYRRYGVGRMLVTTLENWALQNHITRVWLSGAYILRGAHAFYKSLGYTHFKDEVYNREPLIVLGFFEKTLSQTPSSIDQ